MILLAFAGFAMPLLSQEFGDQEFDSQEYEHESNQEIAQQAASQQTIGADWGDWNQSIMEVDIYTLPFTPQQHELLNNKIMKLKQKFGVGILGEIEQAISQMDASSLDDALLLPSVSQAANNTESSQRELAEPAAANNSHIRDDLLMEEEILALEFAQSMSSADPEGLRGHTQKNQQLFEKILRQLEQLEEQTINEIHQ